MAILDLKTLLRFGLVGATVTFIGYLAFLAGIALGFGYLPSSVVAWAICVCVGFLGHRGVTFGEHGRHRGSATRYVGMSLLILMLGTGTLAGLIDYARLAPWVAYPVNVVFTATISYLIMNRSIFGKMRPMPSPK